MSEVQPQKYLGGLLTRTKAFVATNYQKLPIKAPSFVENIVLFADRVSQPYIEKATDLVDENINRSVQIVQQCDLSLTEQGSKLKQKGKEITDHLKENSLKTLNQGVDLAKKNGAAQYVIHTCDTVANKVISSIEGRVIQLQKVILKGKEPVAGEQNYNQRVIQLAHNITELTQGLFTMLKDEIHQYGGQKVEQLKIFVTLNIQSHLNATIYTYKVVVVKQVGDLYTQSLNELKQKLNLLREKLNNKQLCAYLIEQLTNLRQVVQDSTFQDFVALLTQALKQLNLLTILQEQYKLTVASYKKGLKQIQQPEVPQETQEVPASE